MAIADGDNKVPRPPSETIVEIDKLWGRAEIGNAAESVRRVLDPLVEQRLGILLNQLGNCPPDLATLLDLRAQIKELWFIRTELSRASKEGKTAVDSLKRIFQDEVRRPVTGQNNLKH